MARLYFAFKGPPGTGGDFVSLDHIVGLAQLGFDAQVLYCAADDGYTRFSVPLVRIGIPLDPEDIVVFSENQDILLDRLRGAACVKIMHNQNPYNTFFGFRTVPALNAYPFARIIVPSDFCAAMLRDMGVTHPISRVRPGLPSYFAPGPKQIQIAISPSKRELEAFFMIGYFRAKAPEYAHVPWLVMQAMSRPEVARSMAQSAVFASFAQFESLGLMNLEAMASGCHVVGYTGHGGSEYATPQNGDWIDEGDHDSFVEGLREACRLYASAEVNPKIAAGRACAAQFSRENFLKELREVWLSVMGGKADLYRR